MPTFFIPARSSRHRTACLALYRALVKQAKHVPLPDHVNTCAPDKPYANPIQLFVRRSFRQNKDDTSPRLIAAALEAGHNMIKVFSEARVAESKAHRSIVAFLQNHRPPVHITYRQWKAQKRLDKERREEEARARGIPPRAPLLTKRAIPGTERMVRNGQGMTVTLYEYEYVPSRDPTPLSELPGRRRVPKLATEAYGMPFLRLQKRQPLVLSKIIQHRRERWAKRSGMVSKLVRESLEFAEQEDMWEENLARAVAESGQGSIEEPGNFGGGRHDSTHNLATYRQSVALATAYISAQLNLEVVDMLARSKAYLEIADRERDLAEKEDAERREKELAQQLEGLQVGGSEGLAEAQDTAGQNTLTKS